MSDWSETWSFTVPINVGTDENPDQPLTFALTQNYPNPFSQSTTIRYSLPQSMHVRLAVYDVLGREVSLLANGQQTAGIYTLNFNASHLNPGLYFARIELDHLRFTKRMVLIR